MKVGDLVRYRQGSLDMIGLILEHCDDGDYLVFFASEKQRSTRNRVRCRPRYLEVISGYR